MLSWNKIIWLDGHMTNLNQSGGLLQSSKLLLLHSSIGSYAIVYDIECLDIEYSFSLHYCGLSLTFIFSSSYLISHTNISRKETSDFTIIFAITVKTVFEGN